MAIQEELSLDISQALNSINDIETALGAAGASFATALAEATSVLASIRVENIDASAVTTGIDAAVAAATDTVPLTGISDGESITQGVDQAVAAANTSVPVVVDTTEIAPAIDAAAASAHPDVVVSVDTTELTAGIDTALASVDTSPLSDNLDKVSTSATGASAAAHGAAGNIGLIAPSAALATGELGGLNEIIGHITPGMAGATAATAGLIIAGKDLFNAALEQNTALARMREQFGALATEVEHVHLAGINEELDHLAVRTGANVDGLRNFAASFAQIGKSAGDSLPHIADVTQQIQLLATRASVLNPNLGSSDELIQRLSTSLSRGGRFLSTYGIALSSAQINQEALRESGKQHAAELTIYDKIVAGATLATQQFGDSLGKDINDGSQKAQVQLRALKAAFEETLKSAGAPLIKPTVDVLKELEPILASLAQVLGVTLQSALAIVVPLLEGLAPILHLVADAVTAIPKPVIEGALAFLALQRILPVLGTAFVSLAGAIAVPDSALAGFAVESGVAGAAAATSGAEVTAAGAGFAAFAAEVGVANLAAGAFGGALAIALLVVQHISSEHNKHKQALDAATAALKDNTKSVQENFAAAEESDPHFKRVAADLAALGVSQSDYNAALIAGSGPRGELLVNLLATKRATADQRNAAFDLLGATRALAEPYIDAAHNVLSLALVHATLTRAQEVAAIRQHTLANGTVDWLAVLNDLQPVINTAAIGLAGYSDLIDKVGNTTISAVTVQASLTSAVNTGAEAALLHASAIGHMTDAQLLNVIALHTGADGTVDYIAALKQVDPAAAAVVEAQAALDSGLGGIAGAFNLAKAAADSFKTSLDIALNPLIAANEANVAYHESIDKITAALQKAGVSLDVNTKLGQDTIKNIDDLVSKGDTYIDSLIRQGASQDQVTAAQNAQIAQLTALEQKFPALAPLIDVYIAKLRSVPATVTTTVELQIQDFLASLKLVNDGLNAIPKDKLVNIPGIGGAPGAASGGSFDAWQPVFVGEKGPELVTFPKDFQVHPAGTAPGGGSQVNQTVNIFESVTPEATAQAVSARIARDANR